MDQSIAPVDKDGVIGPWPEYVVDIEDINNMWPWGGTWKYDPISGRAVNKEIGISIAYLDRDHKIYSLYFSGVFVRQFACWIDLIDYLSALPIRIVRDVAPQEYPF